MDVWVYEIYSTKNTLPVPSSGINFFKTLDFFILIVDNLGKFWVFIVLLFFVDTQRCSRVLFCVNLPISSFFVPSEVTRIFVFF